MRKKSEGRGSCLENEPTDNILDTLSTKNQTLYFTYDEQCKLTFGKNATHCSVLQVHLTKDLKSYIKY